MGTVIFYDETLPAGDLRTTAADKCHVENLRPSGTGQIHIRVGEIGAEDQGGGASFIVDEASAAALIEGIEHAFISSGRPLQVAGHLRDFTGVTRDGG